MYASEEQVLLGSDDNNARRRRASSIFEAMTLPENEQSVHTVELFSDLVVVVGVHLLSDDLAEKEGHAMWTDWAWYLVRFVFVMYTWNGCAAFANVSSGILAGAEYHALEYAIILACMTIIVLMVKAFTGAYGETLGIIIFFVGRFIVSFGVLSQSIRGRSHPRATQHGVATRLKALELVGKTMILFSFLEIIPFVVGAVLDKDGPYLLLGAIGTVVFVLIRLTFLAKVVNSEEYNHQLEPVLHLEHIEERYSLMVLILLGELCFASASDAGTFVESLAALATAFGIYFHYFQTHVRGETPGWNQSANAYVMMHSLHLLLFFAICAMGIGFVQVFEADENGERHGDNHSSTVSDEEDKDEDGNGDGMGSTWYHEARTVLAVSTSVILFVMAGFEALSSDPSGYKARVSSSMRSLLVLCFAILGSILCLIVDAIEVMVPIYLSVTAAVHLWSCHRV